MNAIFLKFSQLRSFAKTSILLRFSGFMPLFAILLYHSLTQTEDNTIFLYIAIICSFLWPFIAMFLALYLKEEQNPEVYNTLIDAFVAGIGIGVYHAPLFLCLSAFGITAIGALSTYGWRQSLWQIIIFVSSVAIGLSSVGFKIILFSGPGITFTIVILSTMILTSFWITGFYRIKIAKKLALQLEQEKKSLDDITNILASVGPAFDVKHLMKNVVIAIQDDLSFDGVILFIHNSEENKLQQKFIFSKHKSDEELKSSSPITIDLNHGSGFIFNLFNENRNMWMQDINPTFINNPADVAFYSIQPFSSLLGIPIIVGGGKIGILIFSFRQSSKSPPKSALDKISQYISHIAFVIENDILYNKSVSVSKELQITNESLNALFNRVKKYLSPQISASIFSSQETKKTHVQRRWLTVYCSDIENFTKISESLSPEELQKLLNSYLNAMTEVVIEHGGTIDKYIGDMITVFFGDPETLGPKEDALRCVKMSLALNARLEKLREEWLEEGLVQTFKIRSAICSGILLVGNIGGHTRQDYTVYGSAINEAMALQSKAESGGVLISDSTYALVKNDFACIIQESTNHVVDSSMKYYKLLGQLSENIDSLHLTKSTEHFILDLTVPRMAPTDLSFIRTYLNIIKDSILNEKSFLNRLLLKIKNFKIKRLFKKNLSKGI